MPGGRAFAGGRFLLDLDGLACGFLSSFEGGALAADVIAQPGRGFFDKKHLGPPQPEELVLRAGLGLHGSFYDWLAQTWAGKATRRSGAIVSTDANLKARSEREFDDALVSAVAFPALDAGAKTAGELTVRLAPQAVRTKKGSGQAMPGPAAKQKKWLPSNFRLELGGLDCKKVSKIDGFEVRQEATAEAPGERRSATRRATKVEFPNLRVRLAESTAQTWVDWFEDFVVAGNNGDRAEKSGRIVLLAPDLKSPLGEVRLFGVGIFRLDREPAQAATAAALLRADLYCERMELEIG
jgi:hypothetical protein